MLMTEEIDNCTHDCLHHSNNVTVSFILSLSSPKLPYCLYDITNSGILGHVARKGRSYELSTYDLLAKIARMLLRMTKLWRNCSTKGSFARDAYCWQEIDSIGGDYNLCNDLCNLSVIQLSYFLHFDQKWNAYFVSKIVQHHQYSLHNKVGNSSG